MLVLAVTLVVASCSANGGETTSATTAAIVLPQEPMAMDLSPGVHYSYVVGFEELTTETAAAVDSINAEAITRGMDVIRLMVDWVELEPSPGQYDLSPLVDQLDDAREQGLRAFVTVATLDSEGWVIPEDLIGDEEGLTLADGLAPDSPKIVSRFAAALDQVVPLLVENGAILLAVANEPNNWLDENEAKAPEVARFLQTAMTHARTLAPQLPVGVTLISADLDSQFVKDVIAGSDTAIFNLACLSSDLSAQSIEEQLVLFEELVVAAANREIVFQEFGCPSGVPGSSEKFQKEYLEAMFARFEDDSPVRAVFIFQLVDWSDELATIYEDLLFEEGFDTMAANLGAWLRTAGLIEYPDGAHRPALSSFLDAISRTAGG